MGQFLKSISIALQNIKANPLHTFLSTLGIIIGVAAMVGILALGDGLEQSGREQIANTTSLNMISVNSLRTKVIDDIRVEIKDRPSFNVRQVLDLRSKHEDKAILDYTDKRAAQVNYKDSLAGAYIQGSLDQGLVFTGDSIAYGRYLNLSDIENSELVAVISSNLAKKLALEPENVIGEYIHFEEKRFKVVGVLKPRQSESPRAFIPISVYNEDKNQYPTIWLKASKAEEILDIQEEIKTWLNETFESGEAAFSVSSNQGRVEQFSQGILMFKLIMGAITGISVLVGGIGVMNVLLISVTERTKEIGIRKATGAKKKDIILQFMAESVTISFVGCILGWVLGIVGIFIFVPIVNALTDLGEFRAAIGGGTVVSILVIALFVGIIFGTYPAWRAAQLTPVDAIRHE